MNIIHIFGAAIILIGGTDHFAAEDSTSFKALNEQKGTTLLRKLQNIQEPKDETKPLTWNEILADVLVNRIKIFSFNKVDKDGEIIKNIPQDSILTKFLSQVLLVYKNNVYDKFFARYNPPKQKRDEIHLIDEVEEEIDVKVTSDINLRVPGDAPKDDVELVEPRYHGKQICTNCNETDDVKEVKTTEDCGEGLVRGENGNCVISKLILAIPNQCPIGYRRDRLGYCRMRF